ncbi:MAG: 6-bladed beta-propeller, partial [bacterium]
MKKVLVIAAVTALAAAAYGAWIYEDQWGEFGTGDGEFNSPGGVEVAPNGNVYIGDRGNHRMQYFTATGSFLGKWGSFGTGDGQFNSLTGARAAPNGNMYVADTGNHRMQYFTSSGSFLG